MLSSISEIKLFSMSSINPFEYFSIELIIFLIEFLYLLNLSENNVKFYS